MREGSTTRPTVVAIGGPVSGTQAAITTRPQLPPDMVELPDFAGAFTFNPVPGTAARPRFVIPRADVLGGLIHEYRAAA
jgi:hypothetical protein